MGTSPAFGRADVNNAFDLGSGPVDLELTTGELDVASDCYNDSASQSWSYSADTDSQASRAASAPSGRAVVLVE
jgi:hypothetical protein